MTLSSTRIIAGIMSFCPIGGATRTAAITACTATGSGHIGANILFSRIMVAIFAYHTRSCSI